MKAARLYAQKLRWAVIPLHDAGTPESKRPRIPDWPNRATCDFEQVDRWIAAYPRANVGVACGVKSGFWVLDVDGPEGEASIAAWRTQDCHLPETVTARTGSGGTHYLFKLPGFSVSNSASKILPGIDVRGDGGQIVIAPSRSAKGPYRWIRSPFECEIAATPDFLIAELQHARTAALPSAVPLERGYFPAATSKVLEAYRAELDRHGPAIEGRGGDDHTFRACAIGTHDFALTDDEAWPLLVEWNVTCQPPWSETDLRAKLRGGAKYGSAAYGCKRAMDSLAIGRKWLADWRDTKTEPFELFRRCRTLTFADPAEHAQFLNELKTDTGIPVRAIALPPAVNVEALAAREQRRKALETEKPGSLIDPENPRATTRAFLAARRDSEGMPELVRWQGEFWTARGSYYAPREGESVVEDLYRFAETKHDVVSNAMIKPDRNMIEGLLHTLRHTSLLDTDKAPAWIEGGEYPADEMIAFRNGLLHVPTRAFVPATRRFFNHNAVAFDYDPAAPEPEQWKQFLKQLWPEDNPSIATLQEIFGLALTVDTSFQKLFLMIGPKRSGKGTIVRVLQALVGSDNTTAPTLNGLGQHFGLESLIGKQLAVISDARLTGRADLGAIVENLLRVSGEDTISVSRKNRTDWTAKLNARFLIVSNEIPRFVDQSGALASRFIVLQLRESFFGREDRALTQRLLGELPGILVWALRGLDRLRARGHFGQPASAAETVQQLENLSSPIKEFASERCEFGEDMSESLGLLFAAWCTWATSQGRTHPGTLTALVRDLASAFPKLHLIHTKTGTESMHTYHGIRLTR